MSGNRLVVMANQIASFFAAYPEDSAVASTSDHLAKYWDPVMRRQIRAHLEAGGDGLSPIARKAVAALAA